MLTALIEERGLDPALRLIKVLGGWPVTSNETWNDEEFDLIHLMYRLILYNNKILIEQWISADDKNSDVNIIQVKYFII